MTKSISPEQRFWNKVNKTDTCWLWTGYTLPFGHGQIHYLGRTVLAHRFSWELHNGPIPNGMNICHNCPDGLDNPSCVRPDHLFLGTQADNMADAAKKGRTHHNGAGEGNSPFGTEHWNARLTDELVIKIIELRNHGMSYRAISDRFGFFPQSIGEICRGETWKHVQRPKVEFTDAVRILNNAKVTEILYRLKQGERQSALAREFGVDPGTIQSIVAGKSWKHIPRP